MVKSLTDICLTKVINNIEIISNFKKNINLSSVANILYKNFDNELDYNWYKLLINNKVNYLKTVEIKILPIILKNKNIEKQIFDQFLNLNYQKYTKLIFINFSILDCSFNKLKNICNQIALYIKNAKYLKSLTFEYTENSNLILLTKIFEYLIDFDITTLNLKEFSFYYNYNKNSEISVNFHFFIFL